MFESKTVFVVGAGASKEFDFPLGDELKSQISDLVDIKYEGGYSRSSGDEQIDLALRQFVGKSAGYRDVNPFFRAGRAMKEALPISISIDNYLEAHQADRETNLVGKLGIVRAILNAERRSRLMCDPRNHPQSIDFASVGDVWMKQLVLKLFEGVVKENIGDIFKHVSFISFNYDRCISHYLMHSLKAYYRLHSDQEAAEYLEDLDIYFPYGRVGDLPWQNVRGSIPFGASDGVPLLDLAENILTYSEQVKDEDMLGEMRVKLQEADRVVFLGFAFHEQNMRLLTVEEKALASRIYATTYGTSEADKEVILNSVANMFPKNGLGIRKKIVMEDKTCFQFLREYSRGF